MFWENFYFCFLNLDSYWNQQSSKHLTNTYKHKHKTSKQETLFETVSIMLEELRSSGSLVTHDVIVSTHQTNNSSNTNNNANNKVDDFKDLSKMLTRSFEKEEYLKKRKGLSIKVYEMSWDCYRRCISYLISEFFTNVDRKENNNHQNISKVKFEPEVIVCIMTGANIICDSIQVWKKFDDYFLFYYFISLCLSNFFLSFFSFFF